VFVYGGFGIEGMGGVGCGWGTAVVMWYELFVMVLVVQFSRIRRVGLFSRFSMPDGREILRLVRLGLPISATLFFEMAAFSGVTLLIGRLGAESVAAHQIAIQLGGITFMVPLAIGMAATIRVGFNVGARNYPRARLSAAVALLVSLGFALVAAVLVLLFRQQVAALFTNDIEVVALAAQLMIFVAVYQIFDDAQVAAIGSLRGYKDTRVPMVVTLVSYWGIALPLGASLGFGLLTVPLGVHGFWLGLTLGLGLVAAILGGRLLWLSRRSERITALAVR
jgi:MATE family multidrug resistance protein